MGPTNLFRVPISVEKDYEVSRVRNCCYCCSIELPISAVHGLTFCPHCPGCWGLPRQCSSYLCCPDLLCHLWWQDRWKDRCRRGCWSCGLHFSPTAALCWLSWLSRWLRSLFQEVFRELDYLRAPNEGYDLLTMAAFGIAETASSRTSVRLL